MTRDEAIASLQAGSDAIRDGLAWFHENDTDNARAWDRIHKRLERVAEDAEELIGLPYGTLGGGGGGPKPPPHP